MTARSNIVRISDIDLDVPPEDVQLEIENLFSKHFKYFKVAVVKPKTRNTRLAFLTFKDKTDAQNAVKMYNNISLFGKKVKVAIDLSELRRGNDKKYTSLIKEVNTLIDKLTDSPHDEKAPNKSYPYNYPGQTLYIGKLDETITAKDLNEIFGKFGVVESVTLLNKNPAKIYAFVRFFNLFMAKKAMKCMKNKTLLGVPASIGYASTTPSKYLWLGGIGPWVDPILLRKKLEEFGEIERLEWPTNKNFAYIQFNNVSCVAKAIEKLRGSRLGKRKLYLDYSDHDQMTSKWNYSDLYLGGDSNSEAEDEEMYKDYEANKYRKSNKHKHSAEDYMHEDSFHKRHTSNLRKRSRSLSPKYRPKSQERRHYYEEPVREYDTTPYREEKRYSRDEKYSVDDDRNYKDDYRHEVRHSKDYRYYEDEKVPIDYDMDYRLPKDTDERLFVDSDNRGPLYPDQFLGNEERPIPYMDKYKVEERSERNFKRGNIYNTIDDVYPESNEGSLKCTIKNDLYYSSIREDEMDLERTSRKRKEEIVIVPSAVKKRRSRSKESPYYRSSTHSQHYSKAQDRYEYSSKRDNNNQQYAKDNYKIDKRKYVDDSNDGDSKHSYEYTFDKRFPKNKDSPIVKESSNLLSFKVDTSGAFINKMDDMPNTRINYIIPRDSPAYSKSSQNSIKSSNNPSNKMSSTSYPFKFENIYSSNNTNKNVEMMKKSYLGTKYPLIWQGAITLKTNCYWTDVCFISGAINLVDRLMNDSLKSVDEKMLKITQRLRLDMPHTMEELERRINTVGRSGSCILIASVPSKLNIDPDSTPYSDLPLNKLSTFLKDTQFAAVVSLTCEKEHYKGLLHIFPVCSISLKFLQEEAPDLVEEFKNRDELLMILIKDTENK